MKIVMGNKELELLKAAASRIFQDSHNIEIEANLFPTACTLSAFVDVLRRHGVVIELALPVRQHYQTLDEE